MTFLEIVNLLRVEVGASGGKYESVESPVGEVERLAHHVRMSWLTIQTDHTDWKFRKRDMSHPMQVGEAIQTPTAYTAGQVTEWRDATFRYSKPGEGFNKSVPMKCIDWEEFRYQEGIDPNNTGLPATFSIRDYDNAIVVAKAPDVEGYNLYCDYVRGPQILEKDKDIPELPLDYHMAIMWKAKQRYGAYEDDSGCYDDGSKEFAIWNQRMAAKLLPDMDMEGLLGQF